MIQALIESLQGLAAPADEQLARFPGGVAKADELALGFDDAFLLVRDCPQLVLTSRQREALAEVDATLSAMSGQRNIELWTEDAIRTSPRWAAVRERARAALVALDAAQTDPGPVMVLVWPGPDHLASYVDALERGWSPDTMRVETGREELARIRADPTLFLAQQVDREGKGPPVTLPDGSTVPRLPGFRRWMWDGDFCGAIGFRWQPGTTELPPHCVGHIGFSVVPWKRRRGYATRALALLLPDVQKEGLSHVELTTDVSNVASQRVILANGGQLIEPSQKPDVYGGAASLRFRIPIALGLSAHG